MAAKREILMVDDDPDIRDSMRIILEKNGYTVRTAKNGKDALKQLKVKSPDLMILDVMMSTDTEGFDLAYQLKNSSEFENVKIIIMTSFLEKVKEDGPESFQHILGEAWPAIWFFEKPVAPDTLLNKVRDILNGTEP